MNIQRFDTYSKIRSEVVSFLEQKPSKNLADSGGAVPMEIDYVQGKGKGKDESRFAMFAIGLVIFLWTVGAHQTVKIHLRPVKAQKVLVVKGPKGSDKGSKGSGKVRARKASKGKEKARLGSNTPWMVPMRNLGAMESQRLRTS